jgi:protein TonB
MAYVRPNMFYERDSWRQPLTLSLGFHALVVLTIVALSLVMDSRGKTNWGQNEGDAVSAQLVSSAPIPIPKPDTPSDNIVAHDSKAVTQSAPEPKTVETPDGVTIPGQVTKPKIEKTITKADVRPHPMPTPETAVPYGEGTPMNVPVYGVFTAPNMKGGFSFQNADFGSKYPYYVNAVKQKVQNNWLTYELDPSLKAPHRGYVAFDILRNGSVDVSSIRLAQSCGIPAIDLSAQRAVQRVDTFGTLPEGNRVSVEFWFDYPPK